MNYKETLRRALRTFLQAAVAYLAANAGHIALGGDPQLLERTLVGLAVSAIAAGAAALMNLPAAAVTADASDAPTDESEGADNG
jgi:hypothetical protein